MTDPQNSSPGRKKSSQGAASLAELRRRLNRLGVTTGREFVPKPRVPTPPIEELPGGVIESTPHGESFRVVRAHSTQTEHGSVILGDWFEQSPDVLAQVGADDSLKKSELRNFAFLDTETTGLGSGAGVFAFMVGLGIFTEAGDFEVHQFFLRDPSEERAMLELLAAHFRPSTTLVTFNGRTFDIPLLADRFILSRMPATILNLPNFDLLHPARRLWRRRLASCRLTALEVDILGLERQSADVPGSLIPTLYRQYLQTGDSREMARVLYHNEQDILSMVSLAVTLCRTFSEPHSPEIPLDDRVSLARWYQRQGLIEQSEEVYRAALDEDTDGPLREELLAGMAGLLKRAGRAADAVPYWELLADLRLDVTGHEELAKYYEWHIGDLQQALQWTQTGIALAESWRIGFRQTEALHVLKHRHERILRKLTSHATE